MRISVIKLRIKATGEEREFSPEHAERLLRMPDCRWELADNKIELTENGFRPRKDK